MYIYRLNPKYMVGGAYLLKNRSLECAFFSAHGVGFTLIAVKKYMCEVFSFDQ